MENLKNLNQQAASLKKLDQSELTKVIGGVKSPVMEPHPTIISHTSNNDSTEVRGDN